MADDKDVLLEMFKHYMDQGQYHQSQRAATANILLILAGATIGFVTVDTNVEGTDIYAAIFLIVLGGFGMLWSLKYHERYAYFLERARGYRDELNLSLPNINMKAINWKADDTTKKRYWLSKRFQVWHLWLFLHGLIMLVGFIIVVAIVVSSLGSPQPVCGD
jgi:hypothetical protein